MKPFLYSSQPGRVVFGAGSLEQLVPEVERLGATRVVVLSTPGQRSSAEGMVAAWALAAPASLPAR